MAEVGCAGDKLFGAGRLGPRLGLGLGRTVDMLALRTLHCDRLGGDEKCRIKQKVQKKSY